MTNTGTTSPEGELRENVEKRLGRALLGDGWAYMRGTNAYVGLAIEGQPGSPTYEENVGCLVDDYLRWEASVLAVQGLPAQPPPRNRRGPSERAAARLTSGLAELASAEAANHPFVQHFHRVALADEPIEQADVGEWLTAHNGGDPVLVVQIDVPIPPGADVKGHAVFDLIAQAATDHKTPSGPVDPHGVRYKAKTLDYLDGDGILRQVFIGSSAPMLVALRDCAATVCDMFPVSEAEAVTFILTGRQLPLSRITCEWTRGRRFDSLARIAITAPVQASTSEVADAFKAARQELTGQQRARRLSMKFERLAVFAGRANDGRTWDAAMRTWNQEQSGQPEWLYEEAWKFARDTRRAYAQLSGTPLDWLSPQAQPAPQPEGDA